MPATSEVALGGANVDLANSVGSLKLPSGTTEPCLLKKMVDGRLGKHELVHVCMQEKQTSVTFCILF